MNASTSHLGDIQAKPPVLSLLFKTIQLLIIAGLNLFLWPFYAAGQRIWYRPPNVPHLAQVKRYLRLTWSVQPPAPGLSRRGRKHLLFIGDAEANNPRRLFIKGHFLCAAEALERHYPDAVFLTLVRDPVSRLQSGINYLWVNPSDPAMGPPPWAWLSQSLLQTESDYCRIEQAWFSQENGARRCVVRFAEFVSDLEGTMQHVYRTCFDQEQLPLHVPHTHPSRERKRYTVNRSLAELGIDADRMRTELADYVAWCQPEKPQEVLSRPI